MTETTVSQRVALMVQTFVGGNKSAFAKLVGISNQSLGEIVGGRQNAPSFAALQKILMAFPEVRMEWLVNGDLPMLKKDDTQAPSWAIMDLPTHRPKLPSGEDLYESYIGNYPVLSPRNNATIAVVDKRTIRNYFDRNSPPVLPKDLPRYEKEAYDSVTVPYAYLKPGKHLAFVVDRIEMEPTIMRGDTIVSRYINPESWGSVDSKSICILLTSARLIIAGRMTFDIEKQHVICRYDNKIWNSIDLSFNDIHEVWEFEQRITNHHENFSQRIQQEANELHNIEAIQQLKKSIDNLNRRVDRVLGSFREGVREVLVEKLKSREDLYKLDYREIANMGKVKSLYTEEYGPIKEFDKYLSDIMPVMNSVALEISSSKVSTDNISDSSI